MTSTYFLEENQSPNDAEVKAAIEGNLCRCTGYQPIIKAAQSLKNKNKIDQFSKNKKNIINLLKKINNKSIEIYYKGKKG